MWLLSSQRYGDGKSFSCIFRSLNEAKKILRDVELSSAALFSFPILNIVNLVYKINTITDIVASVKCSKPLHCPAGCVKQLWGRSSVYGWNIRCRCQLPNSGFELANHIVQNSQYAEEARQRRTSTMRVLAGLYGRNDCASFGVLDRPLARSLTLIQFLILRWQGIFNILPSER